MKKASILLVFILCLSLLGCDSEEPEATYIQAQAAPDTLLTQLLTAEPGNLARANSTGNGRFIETQEGYYFILGIVLYYADKSDMDTWVPVCQDPQCSHTDSEWPGCSAVINTNKVSLVDGRIRFTTDIEDYPHLYQLDEGVGGFALCSMAADGSDFQLEHIYEESLIPGGSTQSVCLFPDGYLVCNARFDAEGQYTGEVYYADGSTEAKLLELPVADKSMALSFTAFESFGISGTNAFTTALIDGSTDRWLLWLCDGAVQKVDISELPCYGGYLFGTTLRCYKTNDGYYDIDLLTGEETKLADAQLSNSNANIRTPNCIIESPLIGDPTVRIAGETPSMKLFDGQQWHDVSLPEAVLNLPAYTVLNFMALTSDSIIFAVHESENSVFFYRVALDSAPYTMEYYGHFSP